MLILILIDVQYLESVVFYFEKGLTGKMNSSSIVHYLIKKSTPSTISHSPLHKKAFSHYVLAILAKLVVILKLELRNISKRITSLIFLNIYTPPQHTLTHFPLF